VIGERADVRPEERVLTADSRPSRMSQPPEKYAKTKWRSA
jgi:hypothetical protein